MNLVITGATGFVGRALLRRAVSEGHCLTALVRRAADFAALAAPFVRPVLGDLEQPASLRNLVCAGDVLVHAAARVALNAHPNDYLRDTVRGTQHLLEAALPRCPARFVYISSLGVYAAPSAGQVVCNAHTPAQPAAYNHYGRAKLAAERSVIAACDRAGIPWTILRLSVLYGQGNHTLHNTLTSLRRRGRLFLVGSGENLLATCAVDDAADAVLTCAAHPATARQILDVASDEPISQRTFINTTLQALGLAPVTRSLPRPIAFAGAAFAEFAGGILRRRALLSRASIDLMGSHQQIDCRPLRQLGWQPHLRFADVMQRVAHLQAEAPQTQRVARSGAGSADLAT